MNYEEISRGGLERKDSPLNQEEISGIIVVDKPAGKTSAYVDNIIKRKLKVKVGHIGTIDPFAEGVLPVAIGKGTKFIPYITDTDREYIAQILLGKRTDTDDITGKTLYEFDEPEKIKKIPLKDVLDVIKSFEGVIEQVPPYYSAKRYMGKHLYEWAREGKLIELPPSKVTIYSIEVLSVNLPYVKLKILASSGMYVRALARDIGEKIQIDGKKVGGTLYSLRRTRCGVFSEKDAVPLETIKKLDREQILKLVRKITPDILDRRKIVIRGQDIQRVKNGTPPKFKVQGSNGEKVILCDEEDRIIAIGEIRKGVIQIKRVI
ncbi:tRNA pseudouridine synthase B [bacterium HR19]|nr:tRNA pseudouridine synthase B [bacterium HR19]